MTAWREINFPESLCEIVKVSDKRWIRRRGASIVGRRAASPTPGRVCSAICRCTCRPPASWIRCLWWTWAVTMRIASSWSWWRCRCTIESSKSTSRSWRWRRFCASSYRRFMRALRITTGRYCFVVWFRAELIKGWKFYANNPQIARLEA